MPTSDAFLLNLYSWWRHQMETFSALLAICAGNSPVPGEFPTQRPVTRSFDVYFDLHPNKRLSKQSRGWWYETQSCPLCRIVMFSAIPPPPTPHTHTHSHPTPHPPPPTPTPTPPTPTPPPPLNASLVSNGTKPLAPPMMAYFPDAYIRHLLFDGWLTINHHWLR